MVKILLNDATIRRLEGGTYFDTKLPAFGLRIGKHRKTWIVIKGRNRRVVSLGHYPQLSLQDARRQAMREFVASEDVATTITFPEAMRQFFEQDRWRLRTREVMVCSMKHFDWSGPLARITQRQVVEALDAIEGSSARFHALTYLRCFFNWCVPRYLASSPAAGIRKERQRSRERVLSDDELRLLWHCAVSIGYPVGTAVLLLVLTGQRKNEIARLQWEWVRGDRLVIPREITKNAREHALPLGAVARYLIVGTSVWSERSTGPIFLSTHPRHPPFELRGVHLQRLHRLTGTSGWTFHDLRRTCATGLARLGAPIQVTEKILNHVSGTLSGVAGIYNRFDYWEEQRAALTQWEHDVLSIARQ